jgi:hypothetical protein
MAFAAISRLLFQHIEARGVATSNTLDTRCLFLGRGGPLGRRVKSEAFCVLGGCEGCTVVLMLNVFFILLIFTHHVDAD